MYANTYLDAALEYFSAMLTLSECVWGWVWLCGWDSALVCDVIPIFVHQIWQQKVLCVLPELEKTHWIKHLKWIFILRCMVWNTAISATGLKHISPGILICHTELFIQRFGFLWCSERKGTICNSVGINTMNVNSHKDQSWNIHHVSCLVCFMEGHFGIFRVLVCQTH